MAGNMVPEREGVNAAKFFTGLFDPRSHVKLVAFVVIALIWLAVGFGVYNAWKKFVQKPQAPVASVSPSKVSGPSTITSGGGAVTTNELNKTTSHATTNTTTVTYQAFANGIFGPFGSWFKQQNTEPVKEVKNEEA